MQQPRTNLEWFALCKAAHPDKVELVDATPAERRHFNRTVKRYKMRLAPQSATVIAFPVHASRPRERRAESARSSAKSGDSPSDSDPEPAQSWRWRQPPNWLNLVRSSWTYDLERELKASRGPGWLPGHGDVEIAAAPARRPLPHDAWIARTF